jgi:RNA polymerase sigma factor (sigma-70 family)
MTASRRQEQRHALTTGLRPVTAAAEKVVADAEVIRRSLAEPEFFGLIFDRHAAAIHRYLSRRIGTVQADDLMAETFLIAFRGRDRYDPDRPDAVPWLYGIAANLLRRHRREEIRQYRALARTGLDPALDSGADRIVTRVAATTEVRRLAGVLARLSAPEREVLTLIAHAELTPAQVAEALGIPAGTVRSRLHSARNKIRKSLEKGNDDE